MKTSNKALQTTILSLCLSLLLQRCTFVAAASPLNGRKVLLVSMDGFRHDYLERANTPNFDAMIASGVRVPYVNNTYVTSTFPGHLSIATGLYDESHGMVGSKFYDPLYKSNFTKGLTDPKWWNSSEPVWITAVKAGLKVGTFFWPGTDVEYARVRPTKYMDYDKRIPFGERVETVVRWLSKDNFDFATLYFSEPDHSGHEYGPGDPRLIPVIEEMDSVLGHLMQALESAGIKSKVDILIVSDHGMTNVDTAKKAIDITDYVNITFLDWVIPAHGSSMHVMPQPDRSQDIVYALKEVEHINAFLKKDIPQRFHYRNNRRVMPVFVYAEEGWLLTTDKGVLGGKNSKGGHGYDNDLMSMKSIFVASGPSFKSGFTLQGPIKSVDVYPLVCHLLGLSTLPNNGSLERVTPLLQQFLSDQAVHLAFSLKLSLICLIILLML